jgi:WsaF, N-terminal domain/WsaF, C-terminal domain
MAYNFRSIFRNFRILWFIYQQHFGVKPKYAIPITQINPVPLHKSEHDFIRFNLVVPSLNDAHLFGGIATAVRLFEEVRSQSDNDLRFRIILTDAAPDAGAMQKFSQYELTAADRDADNPNQMVSLADKNRPPLALVRNDCFFATAWWTAYITQDIIRAQSVMFDQPLRKMVYIIQDYEPAFYNWSSHFVLAEATYRSEIPTLAVFNSSQLNDFFKVGDYDFHGAYEFEPRLNETLKKHLLSHGQHRKKQIVCYGRPSTDRNCFPLVVGGLRQFIHENESARDWRIISVGEDHPPVDLGNSCTMNAMGKLSLEDYAKLMAESAIGLSLMASPHPSYPPLEMAHFGMLTITNSFFNKDLSRFHDNIASIRTVTPDNIAAALTRAVNTFMTDRQKGNMGQSRMPDYCESSPQFPFLNDLITEMIN